MAQNAQAVRVGVTGAIYTAPLNTTVPTDVSSALNAAFREVGYATEDGVTLGVETESTDIKAWQNGLTVRRVQTSKDFTLAFSMMETNAASLEVFFNNYTHGPGGASGSVTLNGDQPYRGAWVVDVVDDTDLIRIVIPDGQVTETGEVSIVNGDAMTFPVTITGYPDSGGDAGTIYFDTEAAS